MFKKYRQLVIGIVIGAFAFTALPISATVQKYVCSPVSYKIIVNGAEYKDDAQPALNLDGSTYVPLRNLGKLLGQEPIWNAEKKQVEIGEVATEIDLNVWISIDKMIDLYNIKVSSGDFVVLEKGTFKYSMSRPDSRIKNVQILTDTVNNISFSCLMYKSRTYFKIDELKTVGLIN